MPTLPEKTRRKIRDALMREGTVQDALEEIERIILEPQSPSPPFSPPRFRLPQDREARTGRMVIHGQDGPRKWLVTLGYYADGKLGEIFVRQQKEGGTVGALLDALATAISIALQHGVPWDAFAAKFAHQRFEPSGMTEDGDVDLKMVSSMLDYFARWISKRVTLDASGGSDDEPSKDGG